MNTIDQIIVSWFNSDFGTNFSGGVFGNVCLVIASLIGTLVFAGALGFEREFHGHSAGLRTHLMVAIGACVIMLISTYGFGYWDSLYTSNGVGRDPARLAAQVVSGIGFLGAGAIIQNGVSVKGLTTATTLWVSMAIGLACGAGAFVLAAGATALSFLILIGLKPLEKFANRHNPTISLVLPADQAVIKDALLLANRFGIQIVNSTSTLISFEGAPCLRIVLYCGHAEDEGSLNAFANELRLSLHPLELKMNTDN